jgi:hypothetical protein
MENEAAVKKVVEQFVNDPENYQGGKELIIRTGDAVQIDKSRDVILTGTITAPFEFFGKRKHLHSNESSYVVINRAGLSLTLVCDERSPVQTKVVGQLKPNSDLVLFRINKSDKWQVKELMNFLKMNKYFFAEKEECISIVTRLMNFNARFDTEIKNIDDHRGNALISLEKKLTSEMPLGFTLSMPIYIGMESRKFRVEICVDISSSNVQFWLESSDLREIELTERDAAIEEQRAKFTELVCIETI